MRLLVNFTILILLSTFTSLSASGANIPVEYWLTTEPSLLPLALLDSDSTTDVIELSLAEPPVDLKAFWPVEGSAIQMNPGNDVHFRKQGGGELHFSIPETKLETTIPMAIAASYLKLPAWQKLKIKIQGAAPFHLYLDGESFQSRHNYAENDTAEVEKESTLDTGWHRLLLVTVNDGTKDISWNFSVSLETGDSLAAELAPSVTIDPRHPFDFEDYGLLDAVQGISVSDDGRFVAVDLASWKEDLSGREDHLEVWDLKKKQKIWEYWNTKGIRSVSWAPDNSHLLLTLPGDKGTDLFLWNRQDYTMERILDGLEDSGGFTWSPDGKVIYYTKTEHFKTDDEKPYKVMWSLEDRWRGYRDNTQIYYFTLEGKVHRKLTDEKFSLSDFEISHDGAFILIPRYISVTERPFMVTQFWKVDTNTGESRLVYTFNHSSVGHFTLSPNDRQVAFSAPMDPVDGNDNPYPEHNDNQTDLWILDLTNGKAVNHTRSFEPAIAMGAYGTGRGGIIFWKPDGRIGFTGLYNKKVHLYFYDPSKPGEFDEHVLPTPGASSLKAAMGPKASICVYQGDQPTGPSDLYWYDSKKKKGGLLIDLHKRYDTLISGSPKIVDYDYVNSDGITIPGYLYYPRGYDPAKKYPMIVDYYGGVFGFADGFLWMSNVFANHGYFVYVPTPRGAAGWGQAFADTHPNDWGTLVSRDMNEGVRHIVSHVPGVDGERVAPVSGSYGGFLTMYLLSMPKDHPDYYPYATGISDYGISNLASYWGVGWWGYLYSDMATARQYPWNAKQYYIDHSPLFSADNITVPLLLLHGDADVNVPVMESDQMYTALKVLNREVAFIRFPGEDHGMVGKRTTYLLSKRMHMEWFDKYLKGLPGAFDERMKEEHK